MGFRPEIQALRAVAVTLVVVFHVWPDALPGGYIGVDVFFVISGFLITGHLFSEVERTGRIALAGFWARRIRRLLPAASVVLLACLVGMLALIPRSLWQQTAIEIGASALYGENWVLAGSSVDYLAADGTPTLVQHFWSLSVEEQFYIVWPLLLLAAVLLGSRRRRTVVIALASVFVLSLGYSITQAGSPAGYFNTGTRAWEFAAGGLLALAPGLIAWLRRHRLVAGAASWTGVALVAATAVLFTSATPFPGGYAAIPVAGAVLIIAAGDGGLRFTPNRAAAAPPLQVVGGLSYSIYLWHWPLVVLAAIALGPVTPWTGIGILAASTGLAWLTKRFVEDPVRLSPVISRPKLSYMFATATIAAIVLATGGSWVVLQASTAASARESLARSLSDPCFGAAAIAGSTVCPLPFAMTGVDTVFAAQDRGSLALPCSSRGTTVTQCEFGDLTNPVHTVAVVGNSHAGALIAGFEAYGTAHHWKIILMRKTDCLAVSTLDLGQPGGQDCIDWTANVLHELASRSDIDTVVFATHSNAIHYLSKAHPSESDVAALTRHVESTFASLVALGKTVLVVGDTPGTRPTPAPECADLHRNQYDPCATGPTDGLQDGNLESVAARAVPGVNYLSLLPYVCDSASCHVVIGGTIVYFDDHHLSASFSRSLAPYLGAAVERAYAATGG
ncbi:MAG: acyltransferase [Rhodoglobus sp.]|nr:acyltransferase [Rhodoglobus sp.]